MAGHALVGREAELDELRGVVRGPGRPCGAFVEGEAGLGKTALLDAALEEAARAGALVLRARATASEASSSYAALDDLLRPALDGLARLAAPQRRALAAEPIVREIRTDGDNTIALVISGSALLIAAGAVALSGHDHRRIGQIAHH